MKMIIAIIQNADEQLLIETLNQKEYSVTKLATTGGFLKIGNTTLLIGVEDTEVEKVLEIIRGICQPREELVTTPVAPAFGNDIYTPYPVEVRIGGATIFVMDVEHFEKI